MPEREKLNPRDYEAAFLFSHFVNSCHAETDTQECSSSSIETGSWTHQKSLGMGTEYWHCRHTSMPQASAEHFGGHGAYSDEAHDVWGREEHYSTPPSSDMNMKKVEEFAWNKKTDINLEKKDLQETVPDRPETGCGAQEHCCVQCSAIPEHILGAIDPADSPGFICAYCAAKFPERGFLIKHMLGDHGAMTKTDQGLQIPGKNTVLQKHPMHFRM